MFYIDQLYQSDSPNCFTLYLKTDKEEKQVGRCFIESNIGITTQYDYPVKDSRDLVQALNDGLQQSFRNWTYIQGQGQATIGKLTGNQKQIAEGHGNIRTGLPDVYKGYAQVPIFNHSEAHIKIPKLTFVFVNKSDNNDMLNEVDRFLKLVSGGAYQSEEVKKTNQDGEEIVEEQWKAKNSYGAKGGSKYMIDNNIYTDGKGFVLKSGNFRLDNLYTKDISVVYSQDTDLQSRPHSVEISIEFIYTRKMWAYKMIELNQNFKGGKK